MRAFVPAQPLISQRQGVSPQLRRMVGWSDAGTDANSLILSALLSCHSFSLYWYVNGDKAQTDYIFECSKDRLNHTYTFTYLLVVSAMTVCKKR